MVFFNIMNFGLSLCHSNIIWRPLPRLFFFRLVSLPHRCEIQFHLRHLHNSKLPFMFWWKSSVKWSTKWLGLINSYRPPNSITFQFEELFSLHSQIAEQTNAFFWFWHLYQKVSLNDACLSKKKIFYDILHIACKKIQVGIYKYMYQC